MSLTEKEKKELAELREQMAEVEQLEKLREKINEMPAKTERDKEGEKLQKQIPAIGSIAVAEGLANEMTPNSVTKPVAKPGQMLKNPHMGLTRAKDIIRAQPTAMAIGMPLTNLATGEFEKGKPNASAPGTIFGDGYDSRKHGIYLEFPGIDVGRIPYYFNRTAYDAGKGLVDLVGSAFR